MSSTKVLLGVLAGITAGALLGVLLSPDKGSRIRRKIADKSDEYTDALKEKFDEFCDMVTNKYKGAEKFTEDITDKGKVKYEDIKKDIKNAAADIKHTMS